MAKFYKDKELSNPPVLPEYVFPLQVEAANTNVRVAELTDDTPYFEVRVSELTDDKSYNNTKDDSELKTNIEEPGCLGKPRICIDDCSISCKNGNYCELTGLYWLWKNRLCDDGYQNSGRAVGTEGM